ncbi:MAG TPA: cysteine--tRNA ligase [Candidatus Pacearchaeota archaeon]|nr:cysteine--tRNA ligase [Candidatus Parcubacteria bacterium]HOU45920.1 cysteine--tRNA ligase [Candidatus Pacearchaeota archaeon]HPM08213.1 cysteine--tRNA ligase [Candidatus Pacearchaeota archaeon]HQI74467.1 cysteine--tRNA ligase [Candidatus Pacearchaeota archaeon]
MLKLYNTKTRKIEEFNPIKKDQVGLYTCGPTVYWFAHIGNLRTYIFEDILKRVLIFNGYNVVHVMNITDVGHLTSDSDTGEDKLEKGAKREGKTVWDIAEFYTNAFLRDIALLNILKPDVLVKATDTIQDQINFILELEKKGFTYKIDDGIYFDTSKLPTYGKLWPNKMELKSGTRVELTEQKKNPADFALWKFSPKDEKRQMEWNSPWGVGFPGWHTECVVMSMKYLNIPFDIHCGGIDHVLIHHTNEIAQCEAATGKDLANFWMHGEHLILKDGKMAKSEGNIILIETIKEKRLNELSFRYLCLTTHYRSTITFSWESLEASNNALDSLYSKIKILKNDTSPIDQKEFDANLKEFTEIINNDLDTPQALAFIWDMLKKEISDSTKYALLLEADKIFDLGFNNIKEDDIPQEIIDIANQRLDYRAKKDWAMSDKLRDQAKTKGYLIEDTTESFKISKI